MKCPKFLKFTTFIKAIDENWWLMVEGPWLSGRAHDCVPKVPYGSLMGVPGIFFPSLLLVNKREKKKMGK